MKILRKCKTLLISFFVMFLMNTAAAYSQDIYIPIINGFGLEGSSVIVPILIENAPKAVDSFQCEVSYDTSRFAYKNKIKTDTLVDNFSMIIVNGDLDGRVLMVGIDVSGSFLAGTSGTLIKLEFDILSGACSEEEQPDSFVLQGLGADIRDWTSGNGIFLCQPPAQTSGSVPTLTEWGFLFLVVMVTGVFWRNKMIEEGKIISNM